MIHTLHLYVGHWALGIPCIVDKKIYKTQPKNCTIFFPRYLYYNITLNISTFSDLQGIIIRETNKSNTTKQALQQLLLGQSFKK
jgi:hypothetical protein